MFLIKTKYMQLETILNTNPVPGKHSKESKNLKATFRKNKVSNQEKSFFFNFTKIGSSIRFLPPISGFKTRFFYDFGWSTLNFLTRKRRRLEGYY